MRNFIGTGVLEKEGGGGTCLISKDDGIILP